MKFFISFLLCMTTVSCKGEMYSSSSNYSFEKLINKGYSYSSRDKSKKFIMRRTEPVRFCVYNNKPNYIAADTINKFFTLLQNEFNLANSLTITKNLFDCPVSTNVYLNLHEGKNDNFLDFDNQWNTILKRHGLLHESITVNLRGFWIIRKRRNKVIGFSGVDQLSRYLGNKPYESTIRAALMQELFQVVFIGKDIPEKHKILSILQESKSSFVNGGYLVSSYTPVGMCGFDLWHIIMMSEYMPKNNSFDVYKKIFNQNRIKIKNRSLKIENNPAYKVLFDPRCSGKNTGINTKIGIE